ncbi:hypothetical protein CR513_56823, partial [Mucuna pruriens]
MKRMFLEKFFLASRTTTIRKEICGIRQHSGETLHEYWERFNKLCATCPHHQINEQLLIQYFYEGLTMMDQSMIDAASGGALMDKTPPAARHLISNMTIDNLRLENQLTKLTSLVRQLAIGQHQPIIATTKVCGICTSVEHPTNMCPTLQETESNQLKSVGAIGGYQYGKQSCQSRPFDNPQFGKQLFWLGIRAICSPAIQIYPECASKTNRLSTTNSTISSTTIPTTATIENATSRQFTIYRGPNEIVSN